MHRVTIAVLVFTFLRPGTDGRAQYVSPQPVTFRLVDATRESGIGLRNVSGGSRKDYLLEVVGNGAGWLDYDRDGLLDLLIVNGTRIEYLNKGGAPLVALYRNLGKGKFLDVTLEVGLRRSGWGMGVCIADYDNDGYQDMYITAYGPDALFRNDGGRKFVDVTAPSGINDVSWSTGCAFGDYDRDGYVDLYVANYVASDVRTTPTRGASPFCQYMGMNVLCGPRGLPGAADILYRNQGNGIFRDVTRQAGIADPGYYGFGVIFSDFDDDGWPDIYVANDSNPNFLFRNNGDGTFSEIALQAGAALSEQGRAQAGMGVSAGDYDNDGDMDLFVTNFSQDTNTLYRNDGQNSFTVANSPSGLGESSFSYLAWGTGFVDFDNDGWLDLFVANGHIYPEIDSFPLNSTFLERKQLYRNLGQGRFSEITEQFRVLTVVKSSRGVAFADYDNDGDIDVFIINLDDLPTLLCNDRGKNHWLSLRLVGTKSNRDAIGGRVRIRANQMEQLSEVHSGGSYMSHNDMRIHFGLGSHTRIEEMEIYWPSGAVQKFRNIPADQFLIITEGRNPVAAKPAV